MDIELQKVSQNYWTYLKKYSLSHDAYGLRKKRDLKI
jgi:hypothetical protein